MDILEAVNEALKLDEKLFRLDAEGNTIQTLTVPVKDDTGMVTELRFRRMRADDLLAGDNAKSDNDRCITTISRLTGISRAAASMIDGYDYNQSNKLVGNFLQKPRGGGGKSSGI